MIENHHHALFLLSPFVAQSLIFLSTDPNPSCFHLDGCSGFPDRLVMMKECGGNAVHSSILKFSSKLFFIFVFQAAIGCYIQTMNKYPEDSPLRTSVLMELANNLVILNKRLEAISYYEQALDTLESHSKLRLKCLCNILSLNVQCGKKTCFITLIYPSSGLMLNQLHLG